jgi:hypothetical protein
MHVARNAPIDRTMDLLATSRSTLWLGSLGSLEAGSARARAAGWTEVDLPRLCPRLRRNFASGRPVTNPQ